MRNLALALRPRTFAEMVGQKQVTTYIQNEYEKKKNDPPAWLFYGPTGSGKTTLARILAISLNCPHKEIGNPCKECRKDQRAFAIYEVNASEVSGVEQINDLVQGANYVPQPPSRKKVYILDEAQRLSTASQNLLLKYFEDAVKTTTWIVCTTEPSKILKTLRGRCSPLELKSLSPDGVEALVVRAYTALEKMGRDGLPKRNPFVEAVCGVRLWSPRLILNALEKYIGGIPAKEAVKGLEVEVDASPICRSLRKGDWSAIRTEVKKATPDEMRGIRAAVGAYLGAALLDELPGPRALELAKAIQRIAVVDTYTDIVQGPATVAALYDIVQMFSGPEGFDE